MKCVTGGVSGFRSLLFLAAIVALLVDAWALLLPLWNRLVSPLVPLVAILSRSLDALDPSTALHSPQP